MVVNSLIASPPEGQQVRVNQPVEIAGIAWDGGYGIGRVEVSADGGKIWQVAALGRADIRRGTGASRIASLPASLRFPRVLRDPTP
jgi:hypothetical protein